MKFNVYIHYNDTGEDELWDTADTEQEAEQLLLELEIEDERELLKMEFQCTTILTL